MMNQTQTWYLISGKRYAGKDSVANILSEMLEDSWSASFASTLKRECADLHGLDYDRLMVDRSYKEEHRLTLIAHGAMRRAEESAYWVRKTFELFSGTTMPVIVSDHRFANESAWLAAQPSVRLVTIRVTATDCIRSQRGWIFKQGVDDDASEIELDSSATDFICANNGTRQELAEAVGHVLTAPSP